jgi:hypothetical protein
VSQQWLVLRDLINKAQEECFRYDNALKESGDRLGEYEKKLIIRGTPMEEALNARAFEIAARDYNTALQSYNTSRHVLIWLRLQQDERTKQIIGFVEE